jgi:alkanesulfonate monooxygenase SsuD/methylene tetrahydromethanopterin reductase-like flavin-dependent oxidoreductase (luciferase family)
MFFGSCGHTTIEEVSDETWLKYATEPGFSAIGQLPTCRSRTGRKTRMVYVYPGRYCICADCTRAEVAEHEREYDEYVKRRLRDAMNAPYRFSHNYSPRELRNERYDQICKLGKELRPQWTEDEILKYALEDVEGAEVDA